MDQITISNKELATAVAALGRPDSPVYTAHKSRGVIVILFCGDTEEVEYKVPTRRKTRKTNTLPQGGDND